jgi:hypothetical protein
MKTVRMKIEPNIPSAKRVGRVNAAKLDATTETQIVLDKAPEAALAALH